MLFVLYLAVKAITRGVEAKGEIEENSTKEETSIEDNRSSISDEISKLKKLHQEGIINKEQFEKAKEKILK